MNFIEFLKQVRDNPPSAEAQTYAGQLLAVVHAQRGKTSVELLAENEELRRRLQRPARMEMVR